MGKRRWPLWQRREEEIPEEISASNAQKTLVFQVVIWYTNTI